MNRTRSEGHDALRRRRPWAPSRRRPVHLSRLAAAFALTVAASIAPASMDPAEAAPSTRTLTWSASLNDRDIGAASANRPIRLVPADGSELVLQLENTGNAPITVTAAVVEGRVIGLPFFSYRTRVDVVLPAHQSTQRIVPLDLIDLGDQANGLIPARVRLLGPDRHVLASQPFVADVRGRLLSVYGVFGLIVAAMASVLAVGLLFALWRGRLAENRWQRGLQFLPVGAGLGLTATFTLSTLRLLAPGAGVWLPLVLVCCAAAFVLGYLTPAHAGVGDGRAGEQAGRWAPVGAALATGGTAAAFAADHSADAPGDVGVYHPNVTDDAIDLPAAEPAAEWSYRDTPGQPGHRAGDP